MRFGPRDRPSPEDPDDSPPPAAPVQVPHPGDIHVAGRSTSDWTPHPPPSASHPWTPHTLADTAQLLVRDRVTNARVHGAGSLGVRLIQGGT
ncbi:hypothetical protein, partial [Actinomadura sp. GTD37]|uniref:hypothetical protein n=1 Tax=Actinomadura sp. GTD37 TaxID=1778030 RepID=UPI0035C01937